MCGKEIIKEGRLLRSAKTKISCGCIAPTKIIDPSEDLTNQQFGKLTVLSRADDEDNWNCLCECGNTRVVSKLKLKSGIIRSCGCIRRPTPKTFKDLTGQKFGKLTVLYRDENDRTGHVKWVCRCDCGKTISVYKDALLDGRQTSCGCQRIKLVQTEEYRQSRRLLNQYDLSGEYGIGTCSNTKHKFLFDIEDYDLIKKYTWREDSNGYIVASLDRNIDNRSCIMLHRLIMGVDENDKIEIDHIGHNTFDNRKKSLRIVNHSQNISNAGLRNHNTSGFTGVSWSNKDKRWIASITSNNNVIRLGSFKVFDDAVSARKEAEDKYFGEYSYDNSIEIYKQNKY